MNWVYYRASSKEEHKRLKQFFRPNFKLVFAVQITGMLMMLTGFVKTLSILFCYYLTDYTQRAPFNKLKMFSYKSSKSSVCNLSRAQI